MHTHTHPWPLPTLLKPGKIHILRGGGHVPLEVQICVVGGLFEVLDTLVGVWVDLILSKPKT